MNELDVRKKRETKLWFCFSLMLGYPDSNQKRQDQNLQCYHYTIPQSKYTYSQPDYQLFCSFLMLGYPDSNQERQDQNLQCYHYTIPQY